MYKMLKSELSSLQKLAAIIKQYHRNIPPTITEFYVIDKEAFTNVYPLTSDS